MSDLMWLFVIPFISSAAIFFVPILSDKNLKRLALLMSLLPLIFLMIGHLSWIRANVQHDWLPVLSIKFHLSVDALSLLFLYLTAIIIPISILATHSNTLPHPRVFYGLVLFLQGLLIGFFIARDLALFTIFWEAMLLPLYLVIALWGGPGRQAAALKFIIYMIAGSVLMVAAVLFMYFASFSANGGGTFNLDILIGVSSAVPYAGWLFAIFMLAFAVKTPLFPFHGWLPDAYYQAPAAGTILLSAILSKAGVYGVLRIGYELFPSYLREWSPLLLGLAIAGVFYGGLAAWRQADFKRLIAYSSLSHVNFVLAGIFVMSQTAIAGGILQALNHGITIAALFLVAGWLQERLTSTSINAGSGLCKYLPRLCWLTLFFVLSSVALPATNNFVGELLIFFGLFTQNPWLTAILGLTVILSVIYMLRWMQKMYFGPPSTYQNTLVDIGTKELLIALPLVALILWIGVYPGPVLQQIKPAAEKIAALAKLEPSK